MRRGAPQGLTRTHDDDREISLACLQRFPPNEATVVSVAVPLFARQTRRYLR